MNSQNIVVDIKDTVDRQWKIIKQGEFWQHVISHGFDAPLYELMMKQLYYYTKHNAVNQAMAAVSLRDKPNNRTLRFITRHAAEEIGHENMIVRDLKSIGIEWNPSVSGAAECLPATSALIGYLYNVAQNYGAYPRMGYSFWAESVYDDIEPVLSSMRSSLDLKDSDMSFFVAHSSIDEHHFDEVKKAIDDYQPSEAEIEQIHEVATVTLYLTGQLLEQVMQTYRDAHSTPEVQAKSA